MKETMGQIIRRLRKERDLTQEELAEQLGVTFQAVSKWENDTGMPDISQVVPLATTFGVSADVLFGIAETNNAEEVQKIARHAYSHVTSPSTRESIKKWYDELQTGLKTYPTSVLLLSQSLEAGISLAYPENDVFDAENGEVIYKECIRQANLLIKYSENATDVLRAHMIMVLLHAAYGNFEMANNHANAFPWRADMTVHKMKAYIAHFENDLQKETKHRQNDFLYHLESILDLFVDIGCCYYQLEEYAKAEYTFLQALAMIALVGKDEEVIPRFHCRERGDIYSLLAEVYVKQGRLDEALSALEKMTDYDTKILPQFVSGKRLQTPLLCDCEHNVYWSSGAYKEKLLRKLHNPAFVVLKETDRFQRLLENASEF